MITFGLHTLAMLTWGLGIRMRLVKTQVLEMPPKIDFVDKPAGVEAEDITSGISFDESDIDFSDTDIRFKDR